jgi:hypothetical protein
MTTDQHGNVHDAKGRFGGRENTAAPDGLVPRREDLGSIADRQARARVRELTAEELVSDHAHQFAFTTEDNEPFSPDEITFKVVTGELADRILRKFELPAGTRVEIHERYHEDGHSEWTSESFRYLKIVAGDQEIEFDDDHGLYERRPNTFVQMLDWLDS